MMVEKPRKANHLGLLVPSLSATTYKWDGTARAGTQGAHLKWAVAQAAPGGYSDLVEQLHAHTILHPMPKPLVLLAAHASEDE